MRCGAPPPRLAATTSKDCGASGAALARAREAGRNRYAQVKAFYAIATVVPLSLTIALGLGAIPERLVRSGRGKPRPALAVYYGWLGTLAGVIVLAFLA